MSTTLAAWDRAEPPPGAEHPRSPRTAWLAIALAVGGVLEVAKMRADLKISLDFYDYWIDARVGLAYGWSRIYDEGLVTVVSHAEGLTRHVYTPQMPWLIVLCAPFALLPFRAAEIAWTAFLVVAMVVAWHVAAPGTGARKAVFGAAALASTPTALALVFGQASLLMAASLAAGYYLLRRERPVAAGIALAGLLLKPHLALLVPAVLLVVRPRAFVSLAATTLVIGGGAVLVLGSDGMVAYVHYLRVLQVNGPASTVPVDLTLGGLAGPLSTVARISVVALVAVIVWRTRRRGVEVPLTAAILGSLLVAPYEHTYDSVLLVIAAWMHLRVRASRADRAVLLATFLISFVEPEASGLIAVMECVWLGLLGVQGPDGATAFAALARRSRVVVEPGGS